MMKQLKRIIRFLFKLGLVAVLFGVLFGIGIFVYFAKDLPDPDVAITQGPTESTKIYDRTGTALLYEIAGEQRRTVIPYDQVPQDLKDATVAIEDKDFYTHYGFDLRGIARAVLVNIRGGSVSQGGSTITQQYIKKALLSDERTFTRKIKEVILAILLERRYSKDEILGFYLNQIPYGSNAYGIESASQTFFAKPAVDLSLVEAATLAALPQAPSYLSPYGSHPEDLADRRELVLTRMREQGYINAEELAAALTTNVSFAKRRTGIKAPHFVMYVIEQLEQKFGKDALETGGYTVITTLNYDLQQRAEQIVANQAELNEKNYNAGNAALVSLDTHTGEIIAMVGSRDFDDIEHDGQVNVTIRPRQPGSSFKPFAYATAFAKGYSPDTMLFDLETVFPGGPEGPYAPPNYTGTFSGPVTMRQALARSLNIPAVKTLYLAGIDDTIKTAESLGITTLTDRSRFGLALVLGAGEVKPLEMAAAYGAFATEGTRVTPVPILSITNKTDKAIEWDQRVQRADTTSNSRALQKSNMALNPEIARQINSILSDNEARSVVFGRNNRLVIPGYSVAAKTGTTNDFHDAWTIGYSPSIVTAVWVGNNNNEEMRKGADGSVVAAPIWNAFMVEALRSLENAATESFTPPQPVVTNKSVLDGNFATERIVNIDTVTGKLATEFTPPDLIEQRSYREVHSILHYVQKDNPRGPIPTPDERDPEYEKWEAPVREWVAQQSVSEGYNQLPPTEVDDIHTSTNRPTIRITSPNDGASVKSDAVDIHVVANSSFDIQQVDFFLDNEFIGTDKRFPYEITATIPRNGSPHDFVITAKLFDDALNQSSDSISITTGDSPIKPRETSDSLTVTIDDIIESAPPYRISFELTGETQKASAAIYYAPIDNPDQWKEIKAYASISEGRYSFRWRTAPNEPGKYALFVLIEDVDGTVIKSPTTPFAVSQKR